MLKERLSKDSENLTFTVHADPWHIDSLDKKEQSKQKTITKKISPG